MWGWVGLATHANNLVLSTGREEPAIRAEADTSDVQIAILIRAVVLQVADLLPTLHIENLCAAIAAR